MKQSHGLNITIHVYVLDPRGRRTHSENPTRARRGVNIFRCHFLTKSLRRPYVRSRAAVKEALTSEKINHT